MCSIQSTNSNSSTFWNSVHANKMLQKKTQPKLTNWKLRRPPLLMLLLPTVTMIISPRTWTRQSRSIHSITMMKFLQMPVAIRTSWTGEAASEWTGGGDAVIVVSRWRMRGMWRGETVQNGRAVGEWLRGGFVWRWGLFDWSDHRLGVWRRACESHKIVKSMC